MKAHIVQLNNRMSHRQMHLIKQIEFTPNVLNWFLLICVFVFSVDFLFGFILKDREIIFIKHQRATSTLHIHSSTLPIHHTEHQPMGKSQICRNNFYFLENISYEDFFYFQVSTALNDFFCVSLGTAFIYTVV